MAPNSEQKAQVPRELAIHRDNKLPVAGETIEVNQAELDQKQNARDPHRKSLLSIPWGGPPTQVLEQTSCMSCRTLR